MAKIKTVKTISAPVDKVFRTVSEIENFSKAVPHIIKIEMLSDVKTGIGATFRETRIMKGREASTTMQITEYEENRHVRFISDEGGTIWDSVFTTHPHDQGATLTLEMEARPHKLMARLVTPMVMGMVRKAVEDDMDAVKIYCEKDA